MTAPRICEYCGAALDPGERCDCILSAEASGAARMDRSEGETTQRWSRGDDPSVGHAAVSSPHRGAFAGGTLYGSDFYRPAERRPAAAGGRLVRAVRV